MSRICVIGAGRVGLVIAACFAEAGHSVACVDTDVEKIKQLWRNEMPFYEHYLEKLVVSNMDKGNLIFTTSYKDLLDDVEFAFITVGTPTDSTGKSDVSAVVKAIRSVMLASFAPLTIVIKSTIPVGTSEAMKELVEAYYTSSHTTRKSEVVFNPEFLQEGNAINNFMSPDRIILGTDNEEAAFKVAKLYSGCMFNQAPIVVTDFKSAEMIKYASNAYLATRISFINEMANICDVLGADIKEVALGMGYDKRIGNSYLSPGMGYGGSCFPKDIASLKQQANKENYYPYILTATETINSEQIRQVRNFLYCELDNLVDKSIGVLGLSFKPNTDDIREAPALKLIERLLAWGAKVKVYDPMAMENTKKEFPQIIYCNNAYEVATDADALVIATDWEVFRQLNLQQIKSMMKTPVLIDGRNMFSPEVMRTWGFRCHGMGRR